MKPSLSFLFLAAGISVLTFSACANGPTTGNTAAPAVSPTTPPAVMAKVDFNQQVRPFFAEYCYQCHGNGQQRGGVHLDVKASTLMHITPGNPDRSDVYRAMTRSMGASDHMPPVSQDQPEASDIAMIKQWIIEGANWPDGS